MFTGIIEEMGTLKAIQRQGDTLYITVAANSVLHDLHMGDSIAVNGVCLTVVSFDAHAFSADVMPETFRRTNLANLRPKDRVNLERALSPNGRFGGHIVQGHIDGVGVITEKQAVGNAVMFTIVPQDAALMKHIVAKGSIAIDGISLTVVFADDEKFGVSIIPHTLAHTVLQDKGKGATVNIETDILGKYIERLLHFSSAKSAESGGLSLEFLVEHGFA
ncbi:MAG TPA: riboflavin synthase [Bacilli bacterium]